LTKTASKMTARIIDGVRIGKEIREEVRLEVEALKRLGVQPGLAAVLVGDNPASQVYVRNKIKACQSLGIYSREVRLAKETMTPELLSTVEALNRDDAIDGILVQLPLPRQIDEAAVLLAVSPQKDVDGLHPMNAGNLALGRKALTPCTPTGVVEILRREKIPLEGSRAVIVGRSNLVGKPQLFLLLQEHATVTICHSRTRRLPEVCREADILVAAIGRPGFITADFVKPGAVVIDVGINRIAGESLKGTLAADPSLVAQYEKNHAESKEYVLTGDVNFSSVAAVASAITPVPGGVGPLTIAMLMKNTVQAARTRRNP
jgi:methylenetetrahydrofolate dehydrogenase (NADP+) / methenyltetrahydrofolate cyclohydrolase